MLQELSIPTRYEDDRGDDSDVAARYLVITFHCNIAFHFVYSTFPDASKSRSFQQSSTHTLLFTPVHPSSLCITSLNIEMDEETEYAHTAYSTSMSLWNHSMHTLFHFNHRQKTPREGSAQYTRYTRSPHLSHSHHVIERRIHSSIVLMERDCGIRL